MVNYDWFKRLDLNREKHKKIIKETLEIRIGLTIKLLILSVTLFIIFWFFFLGKLSIYFALICAMVFGGFTLYFLVVLRNSLLTLRGLE